MKLFQSIQFLFAKKCRSNSKKDHPVVANPYIAGLAGRLEWNDRYGTMARSIRHWQWAFFAMALVTVGLMIPIIYVNTQTKIQPVVVETCQGNPLKIMPITTNLPGEEQLLRFAITQFIINARTIIADTDAQKSLLNKVYAFSADNTISFLHGYYQTHNPFELSSQYTTHIQIIHAMPISAHTWQVTWDETQIGNAIISHEASRYVATVTYRLGAVNPKFMNDNPFGIYLTALSWSQILLQ